MNGNIQRMGDFGDYEHAVRLLRYLRGLLKIIPSCHYAPSLTDLPLPQSAKYLWISFLVPKPILKQADLPVLINVQLLQ